MHLPVIIIFIGGTNLTIPILMGGTHGIVKNPEKIKGSVVPESQILVEDLVESLWKIHEFQLNFMFNMF